MWLSMWRWWRRWIGTRRSRSWWTKRWLWAKWRLWAKWWLLARLWWGWAISSTLLRINGGTRAIATGVLGRRASRSTGRWCHGGLHIGWPGTRRRSRAATEVGLKLSHQNHSVDLVIHAYGLLSTITTGHPISTCTVCVCNQLCRKKVIDGS